MEKIRESMKKYSRIEMLLYFCISCTSNIGSYCFDLKKKTMEIV